MKILPKTQFSGPTLGAWNRGYRAFEEGFGKNTCPYKVETRNFSRHRFMCAWISGWTHAQQEATNESNNSRI